MPRAVQQLKSKGERCCSARSISDFGGGSSNVGASSSMMKELESAIRGVALAAATVPRTSGTAILARNIMCYFHHTEIRTSRNHGDLSEPHPKVMHAMDIGGIAVALAIRTTVKRNKMEWDNGRNPVLLGQVLSTTCVRNIGKCSTQ